MTVQDEPLSYWVAVARMGFENDLHRLFDDMGISRVELAKRVGASPAYVSKVLNGTAGNFQLRTMAKWARAIGAIVQVRLIKEGKEAVRVVDYATAGALDDRTLTVSDQTPVGTERSSVVIPFEAFRRQAHGRLASESALPQTPYFRRG